MRAAIAIAFVLGLVASCFDAKTENQPCLVDADCGGKELCVITPYQAMELGGEGWCRNDGRCVPGEQPGCICDMAQGVSGCSNATRGDPFLGTEDPLELQTLQPVMVDGVCTCQYVCDLSNCECRAADSEADIVLDGAAGGTDDPCIDECPESGGSSGC